MVAIEFHDPSSRVEITSGFAPRLETLNGKRVAMLSGAQWQAHRTLPLLKSLLETDFSGIEVLSHENFPEGEFAVGHEDTVRQVLGTRPDAVIIGNAACGSCSTALARAAARFEKENVPTVLLGRTDFLGVVRNAASGMGMPGEAATVAFPVDVFLPESDLTEVSARRKEFYDGLTTWRHRGPFSSGSNTGLFNVAGETSQDAVAAFNAFMIANRWGDGLPLVPPTEKQVEWILRGTERSPAEVIGKVLPRGGIATVKAIAIALAMAGGRPEYLPVLLAAVEAFLDPLSDSEHMQADSAGAFPVVIVNGPVAGQIRLNSTFGCLGPDPQRPAGASIGRALRLIQQNIGGALPGVGAMAVWGAMRFTNAVFAEDEERLPNGWRPHGTERHGYPQGSNSVSLLWCTGVTNIRSRSGKKLTVEQDSLQGLLRISEYLSAPNLGSLKGYTSGAPGVLMLSPVVAQAMSQVGWTKAKIRQFIWENARLDRTTRARNGVNDWLEIDHNPNVRAGVEAESWPFSVSPDNLIVLVSGGGHLTNSHWMEGYTPNVVGRPIGLPGCFEELLDQANAQLGSGGAACQIRA